MHGTPRRSLGFEWRDENSVSAKNGHVRLHYKNGHVSFVVYMQECQS